MARSATETQKTRAARAPAARGPRAIPAPQPFCVVERTVETIRRDGKRVVATVYIPAVWPPEDSMPEFFAADRRTPYSSKLRRRWRMFSRRIDAVRWLLERQRAWSDADRVERVALEKRRGDDV